MSSGFKLVVALFAIYCGFRGGSAYRRATVEGNSGMIMQPLDDNKSRKQESAENQARVVVVDNVTDADAKEESAVAQEVKKDDIAFGADQNVGGVRRAYVSGAFPEKSSEHWQRNLLLTEELAWERNTWSKFVVDPIQEKYRVTIEKLANTDEGFLVSTNEYKVTIQKGNTMETLIEFTSTPEETSINQGNTRYTFHDHPFFIDIVGVGVAGELRIQVDDYEGERHHLLDQSRL